MSSNKNNYDVNGGDEDESHNGWFLTRCLICCCFGTEFPYRSHLKQIHVLPTTKHDATAAAVDIDVDIYIDGRIERQKAIKDSSY